MNNEKYSELKKIRQELVNEINALELKVNLLTEKLTGIDLAIKIIGEPFVPNSFIGRKGKEAVKSVVLRLLLSNKDDGLSAALVIDKAKEEGIALNKQTVSSLLSRLTSDRVISRQGNHYFPNSGKQ